MNVTNRRQGDGLSLLAGAIVLIVTLNACGGNHVDGPHLGTVTTVSTSLTTTNSTGPNAGRSVPLALRDQVILFTFDQPLDDGIFGGFDTAGGSTPVVRAGRDASGAQSVQYVTYADQAAARQSLQIYRNTPSQILYGGAEGAYLVGRSVTDPATIVLDPRVAIGNSFGITAATGFPGNEEYVWSIPASNGFRFRTFPAQAAGGDPNALPILVSPNGPSPVFFVEPAFTQAQLPLTVASIATQSGMPGTPPPLGVNEPVIVQFSNLVDPSTFVVGTNLVVTRLGTGSTPLDVQVPGTWSTARPGSDVDDTFVFTPLAGYGTSLAPRTVQFDVLVIAGMPIRTPPLGLSHATVALSAATAASFQVGPCTTCSNPGAVTISFADQTQLDTTFVPPFGAARWDAATAADVLTGRALSGSATGTTPFSLGTRVQLLVDPPLPPPPSVPAGLFSPFDASSASSGALCGVGGCNLGLNPNGGSHIMHVYDSIDLGSTKDSLELIEWSPVYNTVTATTYPAYQIWCGITSVSSPVNPGTGAGLLAVYDANYSYQAWQTGTPVPATCSSGANRTKVACGGPSPYVVPPAFTQFMPFPVLTPPFDFATSTGQGGQGFNLLLEQNIEGGTQQPNFNRCRSTAPTPVHRLIGVPLSQVPANNCAVAANAGYDIYRMRFTFVGRISSARSAWIDTGVPDPTYLQFTPTESTPPPGSTARGVWRLEATNTASPGPGVTPTVSGVYIDQNGAVNTALLGQMANMRYFRFVTDLYADTTLNVSPVFQNAVMTFLY